MLQVTITSFGRLHNEPPAAHILLDLRHHFRDPHIEPDMKHLTARDGKVRDAVCDTPGIMPLVGSAVAAAGAYLSGPSAAGHPLRIAVGCAGGRHRAPVVAEEIGHALLACGYDVEITHRDVDLSVVER